MDQRLIGYRELRDRGIMWSRTHISRLESLGKFPRRVRLGAATSVWVEAEIDAFMATAFAGRDASQKAA
jgi:predicted DNA-binding transcriptional regulator AlpA